jgi:ABC-type transport system involved in multi-copper enzyme maturation permease subunit
MFQKANPIILREMRGRMRGWRAFVVLTVFLMLLSCLAGSVYAIVYAESVRYNPYGLTAPSVQYGPVIGKSIFSGVVLLLLMITSFISPAFTAGAIAGEREQKTYEVLLITPMRARQIVSGKLGAVFLFLLLLILAALPIQSLAFLFGGVALAEVLIAAVGLLVTVFAFGALGLYVSTLARTTMVAIIITYGFVILTYALPLMLFYFGVTLLPPVIEYSDQILLLQVMAVSLIYGIGFALSINPLSSALLTAMIAADGRGYFFFKENFDQVTFWFVSPWLIYVTFYTLLALLLLFLTIRRVVRISDK